MKKINFYPGPSMLPPEVLEEASENLKEYNHQGVSIAEISHRAPAFEKIIDEASSLVNELMSLNNKFDILWLPGGASSQLILAPMNLTSKNDTIAFVDTGFWATKAMNAANQYCKIRVLDSAMSTHYDRIPKNWNPPKDVQYLHIVSNETIDGTQYHSFPEVDVPIVCDMTSDFLSRKIPIDLFDVIFASAQKNFGIAGITCVLIRKNKLTNRKPDFLPYIFDYQTEIDNRSLYHTSPTFPVYVAYLSLKWTKDQGGVQIMNERNKLKAGLLYKTLEESSVFNPMVVKEDRSIMNACFNAINENIEKQFLDYATEQNIIGIKGWSTKGGFRASMYNAMPLESVQYLCDVMKEFESKL